MLKVSPCTVGRPVVQIFRLDGLFALVMGLCCASRAASYPIITSRDAIAEII